MKAGISVADIAAGMYAFSGILTALYERERTGRGASLHVAMLDALGEWMSQPVYYSGYGGQPAAADRRPARRRSPRTARTRTATARCSWACRTTASGPCSANGCCTGPTSSATTRGSRTNPNRVAHDAELTAHHRGRARRADPR